MLKMTEDIVSLMEDEDRRVVNVSSVFVAVCYGPWFQQSSMTVKAPVINFEVYEVSLELDQYDSNIGEAYRSSTPRHTWYLTENLS